VSLQKPTCPGEKTKGPSRSEATMKASLNIPSKRKKRKKKRKNVGPVNLLPNPPFPLAPLFASGGKQTHLWALPMQVYATQGDKSFIETGSKMLSIRDRCSVLEDARTCMSIVLKPYQPLSHMFVPGPNPDRVLGQAVRSTSLHGSRSLRLQLQALKKGRMSPGRLA
jgi:hypothetical protein